MKAETIRAMSRGSELVKPFNQNELLAAMTEEEKAKTLEHMTAKVIQNLPGTRSTMD